MSACVSQNGKMVSGLWMLLRRFRLDGALHGLGLIFAKQDAMKIVASKVKRSGVYYLMTTVASVNESRNTRSDIWGAVTVVALLLGAVVLMRMFLTV
jgi:hypothetical protein